MIDKTKGLSPSNFARNMYGLYFIPWMTATSYRPVGKNIFDDEWDLAIILDACRVDALQEVEEEYDFINDVNSVISVGSSSKEWMANTFRTDYHNIINNTIYLTGNAWADVVFEDDASFSTWTVMNGTIFESNRLVERLLYRPTVTRDDFQDLFLQDLTNINGIEAFCAKELTDWTIHVGRTRDTDRIIAHYMQPHEPYVHHVSNGGNPREIDKHPLDLLREGHDRDPIWSEYINNLRYALDEIERLVNNFDGQVIITADHGEMLGEYNLHGHGEGILHPHLKRVPWVTTSAEDEGTDDVDVSLEESTSSDVNDRLSALGYLEDD